MPTIHQTLCQGLSSTRQRSTRTHGNNSKTTKGNEQQAVRVQENYITEMKVRVKIAQKKTDSAETQREDRNDESENNRMKRFFF